MTNANTMEPRALDRAIAERLGYTVVFEGQWAIAQSWVLNDPASNPANAFSFSSVDRAWSSVPRFSREISLILTLPLAPGERIDIVRYPDGSAGVVIHGISDMYAVSVKTASDIAYHVALGWLRVSAWQRDNDDNGGDAAAG